MRQRWWAAPVCKTGVLRTAGGSNPSASTGSGISRANHVDELDSVRAPCHFQGIMSTYRLRGDARWQGREGRLCIVRRSEPGSVGRGGVF